MDAPWLETAKKEMGVEEVPGPEDNPRIEEYLRTTTHPLPTYYTEEKVPWCSAFVNWVFRQNGIPGTDSAWSQSWLDWGRKVKKPQPGAVVVFYYGNGRGHAGFIWDFDEDGLFVLGGNQSNSVSISYYYYDRVKGYRWPNV